MLSVVVESRTARIPTSKKREREKEQRHRQKTYIHVPPSVDTLMRFLVREIEFSWEFQVGFFSY